MRTYFKRAALATALLGSAVGAGMYGYHYWTIGRFLEDTDDAYVKADYTIIAPKVSGYITEVAAHDNEAVKAGQVLARIDDRDFRTALGQAQADVATAQAGIKNIDAELDLQNSVIAEAKASVAADEATAGFAREDAARYRALVKTGATSVQTAQQATTSLEQKIAVLQHDSAGLAAAKKQVAVLEAARAKAETLLTHNQAVEHQAELNLSYTTIASPIDGTIGARSLRVGQFVQAGTQLMAVVPLHAVYIVANFKETQLTNIRRGQPVAVGIDSFPGKTIRGEVDSVAPASGLEFALLPPDNATGNFTKIVQRIPVKITINRDSPLIGLLRPGMSVEPVIDTKAAASMEAQGDGKTPGMSGGNRLAAK